MPNYVTDWTNNFFHQSAFDVPVRYPNQRIIKSLSKFKKDKKIKLYRGVNYYNEGNKEITSWTYDLGIAKRYAKELNGRIISREFLPAKVLLDTTLLNPVKKKQIGYDYEIDDKEVLILGL